MSRVGTPSPVSDPFASLLGVAILDGHPLPTPDRGTTPGNPT